MKIEVDYATFKVAADRLGTDSGDRTTLFWTPIDSTLFGTKIHMAMNQGLTEWNCIVFVDDVGEMELTDFLKSAVRVNSIE